MSEKSKIYSLLHILHRSSAAGRNAAVGGGTVGMTGSNGAAEAVESGLSFQTRQMRRVRRRAARPQRVLLDAAVFICCFLLARAQLLGGLYPLGPAVLAAAAVIYPHRGALFALPVLLGIVSAAHGADLIVYSAVTLLLTAIFLLYTVDSKKQWFVVPGMVFAALLVSKGLLLALDGYSDYRLMISLFESLICAGMSLIFMLVIASLRRFDAVRRFSADETACLFLSCAGVLCGLVGVRLGLLDLQSMFSRLLIMVTAFIAGGGAGAAAGALLGIVPSLSQPVEPSIVAGYCFSGLLAGLFSGFGRIGSAVGFVLGDLVLALYVRTAEQVAAGLLASSAAALIFLLLPAKLYKNMGHAFLGTGLKSAAAEKNGRLLRMTVRKLRDAADVFKGLSASLSRLSPADQINEEANVRTAMEQLSHQLCSGCSMRDICWEIDYHQTFRGIVSLFDAVRTGGLAEIKDAPDNFARRCPHIRELIAIVNCLYDLYCRSNYWQLQRINSRRLIGSQLAGVSQVLEKIAAEVSEFGNERELLERELHRSLQRRGLAVESAGINSIGKRAVDLWVQYSECPGDSCCMQAVSGEVSRLLGSDYQVQEKLCSGRHCGGRCVYRLLARGAHRLTLGRAQLAKSGHDSCGDSGGVMLLDEGRQLLLISDGMGVGAAAARESGEAVELISRLLESGFERETAIDVVNAALSLRGNAESFVTLDLCMIDLYSTIAAFIKTGAAASYIKRGSSIRVVHGCSLPVGMLYSVEKETVVEQLLPGDMVIMASDGLLDAEPDEQGHWLERVLADAAINDPQVLAQYLLDQVIEFSGGRLRDDISVLVARLGDAS